MSPRRGGWTLHEAIISLAVTGIIVALATGAAMGQLRFFRGVGEIAALRTQVGQAAAIAGNVLRDVATAADIHVAADSAIEASVTIGAAVSCATDTGRIVTPTASADGHTLAGFSETPQPGDGALAFVHDSVGSNWLAMRIASLTTASNCSLFPDAAGGFAIDAAEPFVIPAGAPIRLVRRTRLSLYRSSGGDWYLGLKEWNGALQRFNTIQPVAGPLKPYSATSSRTGLLFEYRDSVGSLLSLPIDPGRIATITVVARGRSVRPARVSGMSFIDAPFAADSAVVSVAIR